MTKISIFFLWFTLALASSKEPAVKPQGLHLKLPHNAVIWPSAKVVNQIQIGTNFNVSIHANGQAEEFIKFYDQSYSDWEIVNEWQQSSIIIDRVHLWKAWKRDKTYLIVAFAKRGRHPMAIIHSYMNRKQFELHSKESHE